MNSSGMCVQRLATETSGAMIIPSPAGTSGNQLATYHWPLRFPIAAILLFGAGAKMINAPAILLGDGLLASQHLLLSVIGFEAAVGTWLQVRNNPSRSLLHHLRFQRLANLCYAFLKQSRILCRSALLPLIRCLSRQSKVSGKSLECSPVGNPFGFTREFHVLPGT